MVTSHNPMFLESDRGPHEYLDVIVDLRIVTSRRVSTLAWIKDLNREW